MSDPAENVEDEPRVNRVRVRLLVCAVLGCREGVAVEIEGSQFCMEHMDFARAWALKVGEEQRVMMLEMMEGMSSPFEVRPVKEEA